MRTQFCNTFQKVTVTELSLKYLETAAKLLLNISPTCGAGTDHSSTSRIDHQGSVACNTPKFSDVFASKFKNFF